MRSGIAPPVRTKAGVVASSHGSATAAPMPRRTVRREIGFIGSSSLFNILTPPEAERVALHDFHDQRREFVLVLRERGQNAIDGPFVVGFEPVDRILTALAKDK